MLTRQFLLQVLVVFVAKLVLRDQCAGFGITCNSRELPVLSIFGEPTYPCTRIENRRSAAILSQIMEGRVAIPASDAQHPIITVSKLPTTKLPGYLPSHQLYTGCAMSSERSTWWRLFNCCQCPKRVEVFGGGFGWANFVLAPRTSIDSPKSLHPGKHASPCS